MILALQKFSRVMLVTALAAHFATPSTLLACIDELPPSREVAMLPAGNRGEIPPIDKERFRRQGKQNRIAQLTHKIENEGKSAARFAERAKLYADLHDNNKAAADYGQAISLEPNNIDYREARLELTGPYGDPKSIEDDLTKLIELDKSAERYLQRGNFYFDRWKTKQASEDFTAALELDPTLAEAYAKRGHIGWETQRSSGQISRQVVDDLQKAVDLDGDQIQARRDLIALYLDLERFEDAIQQSDEILKRLAEDPCARYYRSKANRKMRRYDLALEDLDLLVKQIPTASKFIVARAEVYMELGKVEESLKDYRRSIDVDSKNSAAYSHLARTFRELQRYEEAVEPYETAIKLQKEQRFGFNSTYQADLHDELAQVQIELGEFSSAAENYKKASELHPLLERNFIHKQADALNLAGRYKDSMTIYDKMIDSGSYSSTAFLGRAQAYFGMKNYEYAFFDVSRFMRDSSGTIESYELRAKLWDIKKKPKKAAEDRAKAAELTQELEELKRKREQQRAERRKQQTAERAGK